MTRASENQVSLDPVHDAPLGERAYLRRLVLGRRREAVAVFAQDVLRQLDDVLALVIVLSQRDVTSERLLIAFPDAARQVLHLRAGVVVVVLALDLPSRSVEHASDAVAERGITRRADVNGPGRVRADEFNLDAALVANWH